MGRMITKREKMLLEELKRIALEKQIQREVGCNLLEKYRLLAYERKVVMALETQVSLNNGEFNKFVLAA